MFHVTSIASTCHDDRDTIVGAAMTPVLSSESDAERIARDERIRPGALTLSWRGLMLYGNAAFLP